MRMGASWQQLRLFCKTWASTSSYSGFWNSTTPLTSKTYSQTNGTPQEPHFHDLMSKKSPGCTCMSVSALGFGMLEN